MKKVSLKEKMAAGMAQPDKFAAADAAMSAGTLDRPAPAPVGTPTPTPKPKRSRAPDAKSRVGSSRKQPKGDSAIIRETFSLPPDESAQIDSMRLRSAQAGVMLNRSETIRAGIAALRYLDEKAFAEVVARVPKLKTGRPS